MSVFPAPLPYPCQCPRQSRLRRLTPDVPAPLAFYDVGGADTDTYRTRFYLGGSSGLRGYQIGEYQGTSQAVAHAELRSAPLAVFSQRFGALAFYDVGGAAESFGQLAPRHDVGVGFRWLIPQLASSVLRIDWAIATQDGPYTHAGLPGRISAGFMQSFWLLDSPKGYIPSY